MTSKLRKCFCGGEAELIVTENNEYVVKCTKDDSHYPHFFSPTELTAIILWNNYFTNPYSTYWAGGRYTQTRHKGTAVPESIIYSDYDRIGIKSIPDKWRSAGTIRIKKCRMCGELPIIIQEKDDYIISCPVCGMVHPRWKNPVLKDAVSLWNDDVSKWWVHEIQRRRCENKLSQAIETKHHAYPMYLYRTKLKKAAGNEPAAKGE